MHDVKSWARRGDTEPERPTEQQSRAGSKDNLSTSAAEELLSYPALKERRGRSATRNRLRAVTPIKKTSLS